MSKYYIILCAFIWGTTTFLNKLSADKMSPILMQVIVALCYIAYIPFAFKFSPASELKWCWSSAALTGIASIMAIIGNVIFYTNIRGSGAGSSAMLLSLYPAITLILSVVFLGEKLSYLQISGIIFMIFGAFLLTFK
jgi:drug/metabolite transporter (DMT)-like permease